MVSASSASRTRSMLSCSLVAMSPYAGDAKFRRGSNTAGRSHPWTNTSVGGNFRRNFRTIGPYEFPQPKVWTNDWSIWISPELSMDQWRSKFSESFSLDRYWSIECSSLHSDHPLQNPSCGFQDRGRSREDRGKIKEDRGSAKSSRKIEKDRGKIEERSRKDRGRPRKDWGRSRKIDLVNRFGAIFRDVEVFRSFADNGEIVL